jgi:Bacterial regulatory proteins, luxR family
MESKVFQDALSGRGRKVSRSMRCALKRVIGLVTACKNDRVRMTASPTLSAKTISTYRTRILEKLGVTNSAAIVQYEIRNGL